MAEEELSAEQQLLNLIETADQDATAPKEGEVKEGPAGQGPAAATQTRPLPLVSKDVFRGRLAHLKDTFQVMFKGKDMSFGLDLSNNVLIGLTVAMTAYLALFSFFNMKKANDFDDLKRLPQVIAEGTQTSDVLVNSELLREKLLSRDLFSPKPEEMPKEVAVDKGPRIDELIKDLRLVGISYSPIEGESYVMVENIETELTYILQQGEKISGFSVDRILTDKAVLRLGDERVDLK